MYGSKRLALIALTILCAAGCAASKGKRTPAPANSLKPSAYQPAQTYSERAAGVSARTFYTTEAGAAYRVEIQDVLIAPSSTSKDVKLGIAAVVEVRAGQGTAVIAGDKRELQPGSVFAVSAGQDFTVNAVGGPVHLHVIALEAGQ
jgi:hypothetical protein